MKNIYFKVLFSIFIFVFAVNSKAQNSDSLFIVDAKYDSLLRSDGEGMTNLFYKHNNDVLINNLGPYGSPFYYPTTFSLYKKLLIESCDVFNTKIYNLSGFKPYTNVSFINASRKEQQFSIRHVQEFGKFLFFDFDFKRFSSPGEYLNQESNNTMFNGNLEYYSKKRNYEIKFSNGVYRNFYEENGGLVAPKNYEISLFDEKQNYAVTLPSSNSFMKRFDYKLQQKLDLFQFYSDSLNKKKIYLKHQISYSTKQKVFYDNDPLSKIYNDIFIDSISTIDSIYTNSFSNSGFLGFGNEKYFIELFGQYDQNEYVQSFGVSTVYYNTYSGISSTFKNSFFKVVFMSKVCFDGYAKGDIESDFLISYNKDKYSIKGGVRYFLNEADLKHVYYNSNHFSWENTSFEKQSIFDLEINFELKKLQLEFNAETKFLTNTLYFDSMAIASQNNNSASISSFSLAKNYKFLSFHFRTFFIYQISSDDLLFPLPEIIGRQSLYYQKYIFKGALKFQIGFGLSYSTSYFGYAYMPAINEYYVQNKTELGYYPKLDIFINTHLKRAQIFLKYEHINSGGSLAKSFVAPGYPSMERSLKFGVSWNMFD